MKYFRQILLLISFFHTFVAEANDAATTTHRVLKIATQPSSPPFSMQGSYEGLSVDGLEVRMMYEICRRLNALYEPVLAQWEGILPAVILGGSFDFSSTVMDITPERAKNVDFVPWFESSPAIALPLGNEMISKDQLKGLKVGAIVSSTFGQLALDCGAAELVSYKSDSDGFLALSQGKIDAMVIDKTMGLYTIAKHPHLNIKLFVDPSFAKNTKGLAFSKKQTHLRLEVEAALKAMKSDGTYQKIINSILASDK